MSDIRSSRQNAKLWSLLHDIARQVDWPCWYEGKCTIQKIDAESWKTILSAGLERSQRMAQGIEGGYVLLGQKTSRMSVQKMNELIELVQFFGSSKGVKFTIDEDYEEITGDRNKS